MKWFLLLLIIIVTIKRGESVDCNLTPKTTLARLKNDVMCEYDKTVRPVIAFDNTTVISMAFVMRQFSFDETYKQFTINAWVMTMWDDQHLKWDPEKYENIKEIAEESDDIWTPDVSVYNGDVSHKDSTCNNVKCNIRHDGSVSCAMPCSYVTLCDMDFTYWPYDRQNCSLHMGSWISSSEEIDYNINETSTHDFLFTGHNQFKLLYSNVIKDVATIETNCCGTMSFPALKFFFIVERHASFQEALILFPIFVMLAINLIGLWLEPGCYERLLLLISNLVLHFLLILNVTYYIPKNGSAVPKIIFLIRDSTIMTAVLLLETVITTSIAHFKSVAPVWIEFGTIYITDSAVGKYFVSENLNEPSLAIISDELDDNEALIETPNIKPKNTKEYLTWKLFAKLIDRLLFLIYVIVYIIIFFSLIPMGYEKLPEKNSS